MDKKIHGVNLGGWLVLEKWITPSLFKKTNAVDEYTFSKDLSKSAIRTLNEHRQNYITEKDFQFIANCGLNAVRIPVGYWIFGGFPPFVEGIKFLDYAMEQTKKVGLDVLIDLHAAPGSQNGWDHSGRSGEINWPKDSKNINITLDILERLAKRYNKSSNLIGIELLNEPHWDIPLEVLQRFYLQGYQRVRKHCAESVTVIISDSFRPFDWQNFIHTDIYNNVTLDLHHYQCFSEEDINLDLEGHLKKTAELANHFNKIKLPLIVGEWSLGLNPKTFEGISSKERYLAFQAYANAQLSVYGQTKGWFFWTYKTEDMPNWSLKDSIKNNWLPNNFKY